MKSGDKASEAKIRRKIERAYSESKKEMELLRTDGTTTVKTVWRRFRQDGGHEASSPV